MRKDAEASYGVIIPETNVKHLMLKTEVLEAVEKGNFAIYAVKTIDEGIAILTGVDAGEADAKGDFPKASINGKVVARLKVLSETIRQFTHPRPAAKRKTATKKKSKE